MRSPNKKYYKSRLVRKIEPLNRPDVLYTYTEEVEGRVIRVTRYASTAAPDENTTRANGAYLRMSNTYRTVSIEELG